MHFPTLVDKGERKERNNLVGPTSKKFPPKIGKKREERR